MDGWRFGEPLASKRRADPNAALPAGDEPSVVSQRIAKSIASRPDQALHRDDDRIGGARTVDPPPKFKRLRGSELRDKGDDLALALIVAVISGLSLGNRSGNDLH